ncbi:MAG: HAD-IIIA family hydrolase [Clostridia bacterium]|nr:HAD-IIIA family hydrolase [Clostridia bacterium]
MNLKLAIFDLDGTILDTLTDLWAATNATLRTYGFPEHSRDAVRTFVGNGVAKLIERAVPAGTDAATIANVLADFKTYYQAHCNDNTSPYPGILDLMTSLKAAGIRVAVNSNKPDPAVRALCELHFTGLVDLPLGEKPEVPRKPAPDGVNAIINHFGFDKSECVYIGDSDVDIKTAENAGVDCIWVSYGFRHADELGDLTPPVACASVAELKAQLLK